MAAFSLAINQVSLIELVVCHNIIIFISCSPPGGRVFSFSIFSSAVSWKKVRKQSEGGKCVLSFYIYIFPPTVPISLSGGILSWYILFFLAFALGGNRIKCAALEGYLAKSLKGYYLFFCEFGFTSIPDPDILELSLHPIPFRTG